MTTAAITFGAAYGLAVLCKFSAMGYVPAACLAMYVVRVIRDDQTRHAWRGILPAFVTAAVTTVIVIASGYAFAIHYFFAGIRGLHALDGMAHFAFLFGDVSPRGWWYYFPAALALKTTLASLLLVLCSIVARRTGVAGESLAAAAAILAVSMTSHLNLGVRYILPIFAPLAVAAAAGAAAMLRQRHVLRAAGIALLAWHTGASALAHPDTLAYFNELAGPRPWRCLLDSNLDWGQDVLRLKRVVREKQIDRIGLAIMGWHDYDALGFPPHYEVRREVPSQGWIAVSEHLYGVARRAPWLDGRRWERVGKSIRLYYVP